MCVICTLTENLVDDPELHENMALITSIAMISTILLNIISDAADDGEVNLSEARQHEYNVAMARLNPLIVRTNDRACIPNPYLCEALLVSRDAAAELIADRRRRHAAMTKGTPEAVKFH